MKGVIFLDLLFPAGSSKMKTFNIYVDRDFSTPTSSVSVSITQYIPSYKNLTRYNFTTPRVDLTTEGAVGPGVRGVRISYDAETGTVTVSTGGDSMKISRLSLTAVYV